MTTRVGYWWSGAVVGAGVAQMLAYTQDAGCDGRFGFLAFWGGVFSMGLFGEVVVAIRGWRSRCRAAPSRDTSPADGVVEIATAAEVDGEANARDPRFNRFLARNGGTLQMRKAEAGPRRLLGRVAFASLFLGRDGKSWSDEEIARAHASILRAGEWIEREAMRLGAAVNVVVADTYFAATDPLPEPPVELAIVTSEHEEGLSDARAEVRLVASASRAAAVLGFRDVADLASQVAARIVADAVVWIIHPRSAGRSFVVGERESGMRGTNLAVCYAAEDGLPGRLHGPPFTDPATIAHEVLHLFGASDKYGASLSGFPGKSVTRRDVMRLDVEVLSQLRIDPATAAEIGWS